MFSFLFYKHSFFHEKVPDVPPDLKCIDVQNSSLICLRQNKGKKAIWHPGKSPGMGVRGLCSSPGLGYVLCV